MKIMMNTSSSKDQPVVIIVQQQQQQQQKQRVGCGSGCRGVGRLLELLPVLLLLLISFFLASSVELVQGLASPINRQKRRQRALAQHQGGVAALVAPTGTTTSPASSTTTTTTTTTGTDEEVLWAMAGQTSRRKRQRGRYDQPRHVVRDLENTSPAVLAYSIDPSSIKKPKEGRAREEEDPADLVQPQDIQSVQMVLPDDNDDDDTMDGNTRLVFTDILADVTFINGTTIRVHPPTLHQRHDNAIWMAIRQALDVTASDLGAIAGNSVFTTREKLLAHKKVGHSTIEATNFTNANGTTTTTGSKNLKACEWGLKMEPKALRQYCQVTGNTVTETGLHIRRIQKRDPSSSPLSPSSSSSSPTSISISSTSSSSLLVGASPDGLVVDPHTINTKDDLSYSSSFGLLEIKSLWGRRHKKELPQFDHCPQRFYDQIQGQLAVCDLEWCDLILYIPPSTSGGGGGARRRNSTKKQRASTGKNYCILRVPRDREYWNRTLLPAVQSFCEEVEQLRNGGGAAAGGSTTISEDHPTKPKDDHPTKPKDDDGNPCTELD